MRNNNRLLGSVVRGAHAPASFNANIHEAADMYVLAGQLEHTRPNWLRQQQNANVVQNDYTQSLGRLPELVGLFDISSSADADVFGWQGKPDSYLDDDGINFSEIFRPETEFGAEKLAGINNGGSEMDQGFRDTCRGQATEKESDAAEEGVVLIIDSDSESNNDDDDDMVMLDGISSIITERNNFSLLDKRKAEFAVEESNYHHEKRTKVDAALISDGAMGTKAKASRADASKASVGRQKPGYKSGRATYPSRNPEINSLAEKMTSQKINDKVQCLLETTPGSNKENNSRLEKLDDIIIYTKFLQNQCMQYFQLLSEKYKHQNPTPEKNINKFAVITKSPGYMRNFAANVSLSAVNTNFAYLTQQTTANYVPNYWQQQAFAPQIAPRIPSTSAIPIQRQHFYYGPPLVAQGQPIVWDPESLSLLYEKLYCS